MYYKLILVFIFFLILPSLFFSCKSISQNGEHQETQEITGMLVDKNGEIIKVPLKEALTPKYKKELSEIGDYIEIPFNTPFILTLVNLDPDEVDLHFSTVNDDNNKIARIEVVKKEEKPVVFLKEKCQIYNIGPGPIPEVNVADDLPKLQVVITPRYNSSCEFLGWEIRYGSIEQGCKAGQNVLNQLKKCFYKTIRPPKRDSRFWEIILFGG